MSKNLTKTGQIREGFAYQVAYAIFLITEWVEHPERFKWLMVEADELGFLDDVAIMRVDDSLRLIQVKFAVHPDAPADTWGWQHLLKKSKRGSSLIQKWFNSWVQARERFSCTVTGGLVTNRRATDEFLRTCRMEPTGSYKVDINKLGRTSKAQYRAVLKQLSPASTQLVRRFFESFLLEFDALSLDVIRDNARFRLEKLGIDETGWQGLCEAVRKWASERDEPNRRREITLDDVKNALGWSRIKPLRQNFVLPEDFVLFDSEIHKALVNQLTSPPGGIRVLYGSPGSGKSTYLSFLYHELIKAGCCCLRHHYFLRLGDDERYPRLTFERASESIIHDLLKQAPHDLREELRFKPTSGNLSSFISRAAEYFAGQHKTIVLIVDGLDEVTRVKGASELRRFLESVLPVRTGLWLVLGTRPLAQSILPSSIYELAPQEQWIESKGFGRGGCRRLLWFHRKELGLEKDQNRFDTIVNRFFQTTAGHPLYSRYTIKTLLARAGNRSIWEGDFDTIAPYGGDIAQYYDGLRRDLSSEVWEVAVLLVAAGFPISKKQILECLDPAGQRNPALQNATEQILSLTKETRDGIEVFHTSFRDYTRATQDYGVLSSRILTCLRNWLNQAASEAQRWAHLNRVDYELGNSDGILKAISREWTVQSIADCRPIEQILDQLKLGVHAAMETGNYGKAFDLGSLSNYLDNAPRFCEEAWEKLWAVTWILNGEGRPRLPNPDDVAFYGTQSILKIAKQAEKVGDRSVLHAATVELGRRASGFQPVRKKEVTDHWWPEAYALARAAALARVQVDRFLNWATSKPVREAGRSTDLLRAYLQELCNSGLWSKADLFLGGHISAEEKIGIRETYSRAAILLKRVDAGKCVRKDIRRAKGPWAQLLLALTDNYPKHRPLSVPSKSLLPVTTKDYMSKGERSLYRDGFLGVYVIAVGLVPIFETNS